MGMEHVQPFAYERARREATESVNNRLALKSTAVWLFGVVAVAVTVLAWVPDPASIWNGWWMIMGFAMLVPAALPWRSYYHLIEESTRRRLAAGIDEPPAQGSRG